jgi:hypothetical protein
MLIGGPSRCGSRRKVSTLGRQQRWLLFKKKRAHRLLRWKSIKAILHFLLCLTLLVVGTPQSGVCCTERCTLVKKKSASTEVRWKESACSSLYLFPEKSPSFSPRCSLPFLSREINILFSKLLLSYTTLVPAVWTGYAAPLLCGLFCRCRLTSPLIFSYVFSLLLVTPSEFFLLMSN